MLQEGAIPTQQQAFQKSTSPSGVLSFGGTWTPHSHQLHAKAN
jgi:hypothetical protein